MSKITIELIVPDEQTYGRDDHKSRRASPFFNKVSDLSAQLGSLREYVTKSHVFIINLKMTYYVDREKV